MFGFSWNGNVKKNIFKITSLMIGGYFLRKSFNNNEVYTQEFD
jgi:hypothetical protein